MTRTRAVVGWILCGLLALLYLFAGGTKLGGGEMHLQSFAHWRYPVWFMYVVGTWEVLGAIFLLMPRTSTFAAVFLAITMIGAVYTTAIRVNELTTAIAPAVLAVLLAAAAYLRLPLAVSAGGESRRLASTH